MRQVSLATNQEKQETFRRALLRQIDEESAVPPNTVGIVLSPFSNWNNPEVDSVKSEIGGRLVSQRYDAATGSPSMASNLC